MRYCPKCLDEYEDPTERCAECGEALLTEEQLSRRPEFRRLPADEDSTDFAVAGPAEDPYEAGAFASAVSRAGIPVLVRMRHGSAVDTLTEARQRPWWEILVPRSERERAARALEACRLELDAAQADSERAAEEEELESER
jgi:hypothetical protein